MPPDPFAGDPDDPSSELAEFDPVDGEFPSGPLDPEERLAIEEDLADLAAEFGFFESAPDVADIVAQ